MAYAPPRDLSRAPVTIEMVRQIEPVGDEGGVSMGEPQFCFVWRHWEVRSGLGSLSAARAIVRDLATALGGCVKFPEKAP